MSIITPTELGTFIGQTLSSGEQVQAAFAIERAEAALSGILCYNVNPGTITSDSIPTRLSGIAPASCGEIVAGKFKVFPLYNLRKMQLEPFTGDIRQIIIVPRGVSFSGTTTCNAGITFVQPYEYTQSFNGKLNEGIYNRFDMCSGYCLPQGGCQSCQDVYVDADWGWGEENASLPAILKAVALEIAKDNLISQGDRGLKSESLEGHSYTRAEIEPYMDKYADVRRMFGACGLNAL